jgi:glycosyltransferase involved in cell wall biosynthesis
MRVAWTGAAVGGIESGSVAWLGAQLLEGVLNRGVAVDVYQSGAARLPASLCDHPGLRVVTEPVHWRRGAWYGRTRPTALLTSFAARAWAQVRLSLRLVRNHRRSPYDCVFQFSQTELLLLGSLRRLLPPLVVHPSTVAAGELRWHRRESAYARASEGLALHAIARLYLVLRARLQRRQLAHVALVVGASEAFLGTIESEYGVPAARTRLLRHPVALDYFADAGRPERSDGSAVLLFASRMSVRKGLELILALSHRLDDLAGRLKIVVLGAPSLWSDYSGHLNEINPRVAGHVPHLQMTSMRSLYEQVDAVLAPSHWEPFSLVTAEALAAGVPVVASDAIGAAEGVDPAVCRIFPAGDLDALERRVRELLDELRRPGARLEMAEIARREARTHFDGGSIGAQLYDILREACSQ